MSLQKFVILCFLGLIHAELSHREKVEELEIYIREKIPEINQRWRPKYHISGPVGWINDPSGFSFYKGEYHLFFLNNPYYGDVSVVLPAARAHWGHMTSTDLVHWKQLPTALVPEEEACFSGSAVVDGDTMYLMYTGSVDIEPWPFWNQSQYIAYSTDGVYFKKYENNPVIGRSYSGHPDFRDPKAWKHEGYYYTVIGSRTWESRGEVVLYRSADMITWEFLNVLTESEDPNAYMWECPNFFELDGKFVLLMSPQGMHPEGDRYKNVHQNGYIIGSFNYSTYEFIPEVSFQETDYGHDFYAAQVMNNDGRTYIVAWFSSWDVPYPEAVDGWAGTQTIIRELSIENNRIVMKPVPDMLGLRDTLIAYGDFKVNDELIFNKTAEIIINSNLNRDIELQLEGTEGGGKAWIRWDATAKTVTVDRGNDDFRRVEWTPFGARSWRIFLDSCTLELFCGEGEAVFSTRVFPEGGWKITNRSPQVLRVEAYSLKSSVSYYGNRNNVGRVGISIVVTILSMTISFIFK